MPLKAPGPAHWNDTPGVLLLTPIVTDVLSQVSGPSSEATTPWGRSGDAVTWARASVVQPFGVLTTRR